jgi:hypothetical protein
MSSAIDNSLQEHPIPLVEIEKKSSPPESSSSSVVDDASDTEERNEGLEALETQSDIVDEESHSPLLSSRSERTVASISSPAENRVATIHSQSTRSFSSTQVVGDPTEPGWKKLSMFVLMYVVSTVIVIGTITFAFLSSSSHPWIIFSSPDRTITALNALTTISVFCVDELLITTCDMLRWSLAAKPTGTGMATFLALGRATSLSGILSLYFSNQNVGQRKWCAQR